jgi:hypothetical protein
MIHSFLLIGQSNAGGRGFPSEVPPIPNDHIFVLRNGRWRPMYVPVNADRVTSGTCLIESFAEAYAKEKGVDVGIIPCADGGSCLDQWAEGELLFDHACYMAELASRTSVIAGVLWHQGESDCAEDRCPFYEEKFTAIVRAMRKKPYLADAPFQLGGLDEYLKDCPRGPKFQNYPFVNTALQAVAAKEPAMGFVSAEGLGANPDNLHFSAAALREFGLRYYEEFLKLEDPGRIYEKEPQQIQAGSDIELL